MIHCDDIKIVFIAVPKTGTRSIYKILKEQYGGKQIGEHTQIIPGRFSGYYSFATCRNPYDRACSTYWALCRRAGDRYKYKLMFKEKRLQNTLVNFLKYTETNFRMHGHPQSYFFTKNKFNTILRFESLEEDFNKLPFVTKYIKLPHANSTTQKHIPTPEKPVGHPIRPHWEEMITPEAGRLVNKIYGEDFTRFGYEMRKY